MAPSRAIKAWVIRWGWSGDHAAVERPVAAILDPRLGTAHMVRVVEALYAAREYQPDEMLLAMRRCGHNPYPARYGTAPFIDRNGERKQVRWNGEIICGHNPFLLARLARVRPLGDGRIEWEDEPRPLLDLSTPA
jgi:hypothetical protein